MVPCPPNWAKVQCSEQCVRSWVGLQQVKRFSPACPSAVHLSKQSYCRSTPVSHRWAILGWGGKSILATLTPCPPFFVCLASWKRVLKRGQHMDCMVKQLLESWTQNRPPAAAAVSLQLFMLQMDKMVVSAGHGRGSAVSVQVAICSSWKGEVSVSCTGIFVPWISTNCSATCVWVQNSAALVWIVQGCFGQVSQMCKWDRCCGLILADANKVRATFIWPQKVLVALAQRLGCSLLGHYKRQLTIAEVKTYWLHTDAILNFIVLAINVRGLWQFPAEVEKRQV